MTNGPRNRSPKPDASNSRRAAPSVGPRRREGTVRVQPEVARRVRDGHPWIFEDALLGRHLSMRVGEAVDVVETSGEFVGRALVDPESQLKLRVFSHHPEARLDAGGIRHAVQRAAAWRRSAIGVEPDGCMRVLSGDSEGIPAINVDRYADFLVISVYAPVGEPLLDALVPVLVETWAPRGIYVQRRHAPPVAGKARPPGELMWGEAPPAEVVVREGHVRFVVDVSAPLGTGLFPDMRTGRELVYKVAAGRRVLNCFSYTGAFSVVALLGGATEVVSVDSSARAHARARRNFGENGWEPLPESVEFITGDAFAAMSRYEERRRFFDLVILDPPTFSSAKGRTFAALKDYTELVCGAMRVLDPGGILLAASNAAKLPDGDFERALGRAAGMAGRRVLITDRIGQPADFPVTPGFAEGRYLKVAVCRVF